MNNGVMVSASSVQQEVLMIEFPQGTSLEHVPMCMLNWAHKLSLA